MTLAILQGYVPNEGDAWEYTLDNLKGYFERVLTQDTTVTQPAMPSGYLLEAAGEDLPETAGQVIGPYLEAARLLGQRTAELHVALASDKDDPNFAPESFTSYYQRSLYQTMRMLASEVFQLLTRRLATLPEDIQGRAREVLERQDEVLGFYGSITRQRIHALRIRCHGDYHLGQVLYTGKDFVIIDFEGEPARTLNERRRKRSPLQDVAGMLRSFHYAAYTALFHEVENARISAETEPAMGQWARFWFHWVSATFLRSYLEVASHDSFLPKAPAEIKTLLDAYLLDKAVYELGYELNNRPDWVRIPVEGITQLLDSGG